MIFYFVTDLTTGFTVYYKSRDRKKAKATFNLRRSAFYGKAKINLDLLKEPAELYLRMLNGSGFAETVDFILMRVNGENKRVNEEQRKNDLH